MIEQFLAEKISNETTGSFLRSRTSLIYWFSKSKISKQKNFWKFLKNFLHENDKSFDYLVTEPSVEAKLDQFVEERTASLPPSRKNGNTGRYFWILIPYHIHCSVAPLCVRHFILSSQYNSTFHNDPIMTFQADIFETKSPSKNPFKISVKFLGEKILREIF